MKRNPKILFFVLAVLSAIGYILLGYYFPRTKFIESFGVYLFLFICFFSFNSLSIKLPIKYFIVAGVVFRLLFAFSIPQLSNDFYRFIWDGRLIVSGINPYQYTPNELVNTGLITNIGSWNELFVGMGTLSAGNYTCYPPVNQYLFMFATLFTNENLLLEIVGMRLLIILADIGIIWWGIKLIKHFKLPVQNILLFALNPFVIIEFSGNLHFESIMVFFFLLGIYLFFTNRPLYAGFFVAMAIQIKLMPLMFLPLFLRNGTLKKLSLFYGAAAVGCILLAIPLLHSIEYIEHFIASINLWYKNFEFNASLYNIAKYISIQMTGYNIFYDYSWVFPTLTLVIVIGVTVWGWFKKTYNIFVAIVLIFVLYLLISRIVHPWYLLTPLFFSMYTRMRFVVIWAFFIFISYYTYSNPAYSENYCLLFCQYVIVLIFFILEKIHPDRLSFKALVSIYDE